MTGHKIRERGGGGRQAVFAGQRLIHIFYLRQTNCLELQKKIQYIYLMSTTQELVIFINMFFLSSKKSIFS